jgi:hypothetical protein
MEGPDEAREVPRTVPPTGLAFCTVMCFNSDTAILFRGVVQR